MATTVVAGGGIMCDEYHRACLETAGRVSNEKLCAWLSADAKSDSQSFQRLFQAMTPLLFAFFEGQLQERKADLNLLVMETLVEVYRQRANYQQSQPFRAWLLGLARRRMADYMRGEHGLAASGKARGASAGAACVTAADVDGESVGLLRQLALSQVNGARQPRITQTTSAESAVL
jgi:RNA polymerase sigma-70 factor, ECF subfamily